MLTSAGAGWTLMHGDSLAGMRAELEPASIDSIVTSPPYADQRSYGAQDDYTGRRGGMNNRSRKQRSQAPALAVDALEPFLAEMLRVLKPAGSLALNLGVVMRDHQESTWVDDVCAVARGQGWQLVHRIIWHKPNSIPMSWPGFLHVVHEYVLWLAPNARECYRGFDADTRRPHSETSVRRVEQPYLQRKDERYGRRGFASPLHEDGARPQSVFTCGVGTQVGVEHPAVMAPELALHLVSLTCPKGGLVLDPFAGSATTGLAALERGRRFIGWERKEDYVREAIGRLQFGRFPRRPPPAQPPAQASLLEA